MRSPTAENRLLVTLDRGFGDVRPYPPGSHGGEHLIFVVHRS
jgi:hypothetical protein